MTPSRADDACLRRDGFAIARSLASSTEIENARDATADAALAGMRDPLRSVPALREVADLPSIRDAARDVLGTRARLVRAILFDKTPERNWPVGPHRDTTIAVVCREDLEGFGPWSEKAGVPHCRPPRDVLESMLTIRVALDEAGPTSGALRVLPGSHRWPPDSGVPTMNDPRWLACETGPGDAVLMRPLTLHSSKRATRPTRRRILHLEWAGTDLPEPLRWREP